MTIQNVETEFPRQIAKDEAVQHSEAGRRKSKAFFADHESPPELSTRRVLLPQLKRVFEHMRQPELPTEFD